MLDSDSFSDEEAMPYQTGLISSHESSLIKASALLRIIHGSLFSTVYLIPLEICVLS